MPSPEVRSKLGFLGRLNKKTATWIWMVCLLFLILLDFFLSGLWTIQENEQGVVLRFGGVHRRVFPGLVFTLPYPFEKMIVVNTKETLKMPVGFRFAQGVDPTPLTADESEWLTGDTNVIDVEMIIHYRISDPINYLFRVGRLKADFLIRKSAESVLTEILGIMSVDAILTTEKNRIERETRQKTQELLDRFEAGVTVSRASLQKIAPPVEVIDAFKDVSSAKADRERSLQEADGYRRDIMPTARYLATQIEQQALAYKSRVLSQAKGKAERFKAIYREYKNAPHVTKIRLFLETMEAILDKPKKIVVTLDDAGQSHVKVIR